MQTYEFSVIASGLDPEAADYESRFYDRGCHDATVSFQRCRTIVDFRRRAESMEWAMASAILDVMAAGGVVEGSEAIPAEHLSDADLEAIAAAEVPTEFNHLDAELESDDDQDA